MSVTLRCGHICVTEQLLNGTQVRTPIKKVCRKAVTQRVRMRRRRRPTVDDSTDVPGRESLADFVAEQRLALARGYFNDIASEWNNRVEQFPDSILAKLFVFRRQSLFEALDFERAEVKVDFAD